MEASFSYPVIIMIGSLVAQVFATALGVYVGMKWYNNKQGK